MDTVGVSVKLQEFQAFWTHFSFHPDTLDSERMMEHGLELFWYFIFAAVMVVSCLMNRFGRFVGSCVGSVLFYFLSVQVKLPWVKAITFGDVHFYLTFDSVPLYLFFMLPVIVFVADVISRESFRGTVVMSGIIAAVFNALITFPSALLCTSISHILVDDEIVVDMAKQFFVTLMLFQLFVSAAMHLVDLIFSRTKRLAFLHFLLTSAFVVGSVYILKIDYELHIISQIVLPWIDSKIGEMVLSDLIPIVLAAGVMILVLMGVTAGIAPYPSIVGILLYVLIGVNISILLLFQQPLQALDSHKLPSVFVESPLGHIIVSTVAGAGLILALMPLLNSSPIAESVAAMSKNCIVKRKDEKCEVKNAAKSGKSDAKKAAKKAEVKNAAESGKSDAKKDSKLDEKVDEPKRTNNPYICFQNEQRPLLHEKEPDLSFGECSKRLADMWRDLSDEEKDRYKKMAAATPAKSPRKKAKK